MKLIAVFIAALALHQPVLAQATDPVVTIYIDTRETACKGGRVSDYYREKAERDAKRIAREAQKQGKKVRIVRLTSDIQIGTFRVPGGAPITLPGC